MGLCGALWVTQWVSLRLYGSTWDSMGLSVALWVRVGFYGVLWVVQWVSLRFYGSVWGAVGLSVALRVRVGRCGSRSGSLWGAVGRQGQRRRPIERLRLLLKAA